MAQLSWWQQLWEQMGAITGRSWEGPVVPVVPQTFVYAPLEEEHLELDLYLPPPPTAPPWPVILYFHGGGFAEGSCREPRYVQFAEQMARRGYAVALANYRLTMQGRSMGCDQRQSIKKAAFAAAVQDVWRATHFLRNQAAVQGLDATKIILAGSSAGAEAAVNAAFWPAHALDEVANPANSSWRYAGLLGFAGALLELEWITPERALPLCLFHGEDDPLVPFGSASHHYCRADQPGYLPLYGSGAMAERYRLLGAPCWLFAGVEGGHGWADKPLFDHLNEVESFLQRVVLAGENLPRHERWKWR